MTATRRGRAASNYKAHAKTTKVTADLIHEISQWIASQNAPIATPTEVLCRRWREGNNERQQRWSRLSDRHRITIYIVISELRDPRTTDFRQAIG